MPWTWPVVLGRCKPRPPRADRLTDISALGRSLLEAPSHPALGTHVLNGLVSFLLLSRELEGVAYCLDTVFAQTTLHGDIMAVFRGIVVTTLVDSPPAPPRQFHDAPALVKRVRNIFAPSEEQTRQALKLLCEQPSFIEAVIRQGAAERAIYNSDAAILIPTQVALAMLPDAGQSMVDAMIATHRNLFNLACSLGGWGVFSRAAIGRVQMHVAEIFATQVAAACKLTNDVLENYLDEKLDEKELWADSWRTLFIKVVYTDKDGEGLRRAKVMRFLLNEMPDIAPLQRLTLICATLRNDASTKLRLDLVKVLDAHKAYAKLISMLQFRRGEAVSESLDEAKNLRAAVDSIIAAINQKVNYPTAEGMAHVAGYFTPELEQLAALQRVAQVAPPAPQTDVRADFTA